MSIALMMLMDVSLQTKDSKWYSYEKTRLAFVSNFLFLFYNCLWTKNIFLKFLSCRKRMSDVYNIKLGPRCVSEADIRRNLKWLLSIGFMTFLLSYKYSMYPDWLGREN